VNEARVRQIDALNQLEDAYDEAPVGHIAVDPSGLIIKANRAFLELTGYAEGEVAGQLRFGDVLTLGARIWAETHFHPALLMHGHIYEVAFDVVRKDGGVVPTLANAVQRRDADGVLLFNRITLFRAAERRRYELELLLARREAERAVEKLAQTTSDLEVANAALTQANAELAQFTHVASHDLQAPLRIVSTYVELVELRLKDGADAKTADYLRRIVETTRRMQALVRNLLELSVARAPVRADMKMEQVLADVLALLDADIVASGASVGSGPLPTLYADPRQVAQLLQNLIGNALKYRHASRPPSVRIDAQEVDGGWLITVRDNGEGLEMTSAERIFQPFERLHGGDIPGTGLGLALCRKVVSAHGGRIWAVSTPGEGSCFFFTFPNMRGSD
jgi:PAS domain S-box-containing protein